MAANDSFIQVTPDSTGKKVDTGTVTQQPAGDVAGVVVHRERDTIASPTDVAAVAEVKSGDPAPGDYGVVVRNVSALATNKLLAMIFLELRALRMVQVAMQCEDGQCDPNDFDPANFADVLEDLT